MINYSIQSKFAALTSIHNVWQLICTMAIMVTLYLSWVRMFRQETFFLLCLYSCQFLRAAYNAIVKINLTIKTLTPADSTIVSSKLWIPPVVVGKLMPYEWIVVKFQWFFMILRVLPFSMLKLFKPLRTTMRFDSIAVQNHKSTCPDLRPNFRVNELPIIPASRHHTHPKAASERTAASNKISEVIRSAGFEPYFVSMSSSDQRNNDKGVRYFYWSKDIKADYQRDRISERDALVFIDVDFHCDMDEYLELGKPILMYTLSPDSAAYRGTEHVYNITDDVVDYRVSGGARYIHKIWDYDHEILSVSNRRWWKPDCLATTTYYNVEQRIIDGAMGTSRRIVALLPFARLPYYASHLIDSQLLKRKQYTYGPVNRVYDPISDRLSISTNGSLISIETTGTVYTAIVSRANAKEKGVLTVGDVEQYLYTAEKSPSDIKQQAALLHSVLVKSRDVELIANIIPTSVCSTTFTPVGKKQQLFEIDSACQVITTPLVAAPALFPGKNQASDEASIEGRVNAVRNDARPHTRFAGYATEFVKMVVKEPGTGIPWTIQQIEAVQNRPLQKQRLAQTIEHIGVYSPNKLQTFVKAEGYASTNDPRVITTCDPRTTVELGQYTYAFKTEILKGLSWYGPGKTPVESANNVKRLSQFGTVVTDFSRFDGTISEWLQRNVVFATYMKWVRADHLPHLQHHLEQVFIQKGRTKMGMKYNAGWGTRSGSPLTTDGNTLINAYISFAAFREMGYAPDKAYRSLGMYAGDDGINAVYHNLPAAIESTCDQLGLTVKMDVTPVGKPTSYLGRIFPSPNTHIDSHQDMVRTLPKLHLTANRGIWREQAAVNKCLGYLTTDLKTPILSDYCKSVIRLCGELPPSSMLSEELYKIENGAWPQNDVTLIEESVAQQLGLDSCEIAEAVYMLEHCDSLDSFPVIWNNAHEHKLDAMTENGLVFRDRTKVAKGVQSTNKIINHAEQTRTSVVGKVRGNGKPIHKTRPTRETDSASSGVSSWAGSEWNERKIATRNSRRRQRGNSGSTEERTSHVRERAPQATRAR